MIAAIAEDLDTIDYPLMGDPLAQTQKYRLLAELGHGGMADVYLAVLKGPTDFTKLSVIKRLRSHLAEDPEFLAMFLQEARIAARLNHPNVVHTFEVGYDGRYHFIAMEHLQGHSYSALLSRLGRNRIDFGVQLRILIETLEGLQYAHDLKDFDGTKLGLVHRDVSPQNIFLTYDGQIKLLDFGIAKALDSAVETRTGVIKGKLSYMSPEQALGGEVDRRSDLYSVGVILWEAIAARRRWRSLSNVQMMKKLVNNDEPIELPNPASRNLPPELGHLMKMTLARNPDERFGQARELQAELEKILDKMGRRVTAREVGKYVARAFEKDRLRIQGIIEQQLKRVEREPPPSRPGFNSLHDLVQIEAPPMSQSLSGTAPSSAPSLTDQPAAVSLREPPRQQPHRSRLIYAAVAITAAAAALGMLIRYRLPLPRTGAGAGASSALEQRTVRLSLAASPAQAELYIDDQRLGGNPHAMELPRQDREVTIRAELSGYVSESRTLSLTNDVHLQFDLVPEAQPAVVEQPTVQSKPPTRRGYGVRVPSPAPAVSQHPDPTKRPSGVVIDTDNPWKSGGGK